jgi:putative DNA primase/helicase
VPDLGAAIEQFRAAMRARDIDVRGTLIPDGVLHRIHVEGDRGRAESAWYVLHADEHINGVFGCWKRYGAEKFKWASDDPDDRTPEQRREWHAKIERQKIERERKERERQVRAANRANRIWDAAKDADEWHPYLARKKCKAHGVRAGAWPVVDAKGNETVISSFALLVPIRNTRKELVSLQAIFPDTDHGLSRDKDYLKDGAKRGFFFTIGKPIDNVILICEGYATGASLHEATGYAVVVALDTSNLEPSASVIRNRFAEARIVMCADNDQWTTKPILNPGVHHAETAAAVAGGLVAIPRFRPQDLIDKPTDFNDLARLEGFEAVQRIVGEVLAKGIREADPEWEASPPETRTDLLEGELMPREAADEELRVDEGPPGEAAEPGVNLLDNSFFQFLGYEHGRYFFFHKRKRQIMEYSRGDFGESTFIELADPGTFWEQYFKGGSKQEGFNKRMAINFLMTESDRRGVYDPDRIRGRGAWHDAGRVVYHHGDHLTADGCATEIGDFKTRYIYELQRALPDIADTPLSAADGERIVDLAEGFRWTKPASSALLCGWIALAPICGALKWRPHVWLSGGAGSGKSTILERFVHPLLNNFDIFAQGNTTEAGLRQKLRTDALPVLFEESEQNEDRDRVRMQHVLSLMRQSSTETHARTYKGTIGGHSMEFAVRSMFCLASIQVGIKQQADAERISILALRPKKEAGHNGVDEWDALKEKMYTVISRDPAIGSRLVRRSLDLLALTRQNIEVFVLQAAKFFGSAREGDQYGTLMAGNWSLFSDKLATAEAAQTMLNAYTWEEHLDISDTDESQQALAVLMGSRVRAPKGLEFTVFEIAGAANGTPATGSDIDKLDAVALLKRYGMLVKDGHLLLSNSSQELRNLMANTNFAADWRGVLLRIPGADRYENKAVKFNGVPSKCIRIPLAAIMSDAENVQRTWLDAQNPVEGRTQ